MSPITPIALEDLRSSPTASRFEGAVHAGGTPLDVSFFVVTTPPGAGPDLHVHPYAEVFVLHTGRAEFVVGDERLELTGGHVVVVPADTPHRYRNIGDEPLLQFSVHDAGRMEQHDVS